MFGLPLMNPIEFENHMATMRGHWREEANARATPYLDFRFQRLTSFHVELANRSFVQNDGGSRCLLGYVTWSASEFQNTDAVMIQGIWAHEVEKGNGTRMLQLFVNAADACENGMLLYCVPRPFDKVGNDIVYKVREGGLNEKRLEQFYKKFGFTDSGELSPEGRVILSRESPHFVPNPFKKTDKCDEKVPC